MKVSFLLIFSIGVILYTDAVQYRRNPCYAVRSLTSDDITRVRDTWGRINLKPVDLGLNIIIRFYEDYPQLKQCFDRFRDIPNDRLKYNKNFRDLALRYYNGYDNMVRALEDTSSVENYFVDLGRYYAQQGASKDSIVDLRQSFFKTMQALLGNNFSTADYQSWNKVYDIILCYMFEGYPN
ncbi:globin-like [Microplitis mediator]|uniref:globin-like n=1 Tax=Microplitis mediator TaxID=375433 RepID=UPI0025524069|nr:globin-like [Microplitis mediator]XP_057341378.1 globin-like [Microplitis mediator]